MTVVTLIAEHPARRRARNRLRDDFNRFYEEHRCSWAPAKAGRIYALCRDCLLHEYGRWVTLADLIGHAKAVLVGLFDEYDPALYSGGLPHEDHFINLFAQRMRGRLYRLIRPASDKGNVGRPDKFPHRPEIGLDNRIASRGRDWCQELVDELPEALLTLDGTEFQVIVMRYWEDLPWRAIGLRLGLYLGGRKSPTIP